MPTTSDQMGKLVASAQAHHDNKDYDKAVKDAYLALELAMTKGISITRPTNSNELANELFLAADGKLHKPEADKIIEAVKGGNVNFADIETSELGSSVKDEYIAKYFIDTAQKFAGLESATEKNPH